MKKIQKIGLVSFLSLVLALGVQIGTALATTTYAVNAITETGTLAVTGTGTGTTAATAGVGLLGGTAASTIVLGGAAQTGAIDIADPASTAVSTINIGTNAQANVISVGTGNAVNTIHIGDHATPVNVIKIGGAASGTTFGGTLTVTGGTVANGAILAVGPLVNTTGVDVSANVGRTAGISVDLNNTASTVTLLKAFDGRVTDAGSTSAEVQAVYGQGTKSSGDSATANHGLWGGNFIASITGGKTANVYGVYGEADVETGAVVNNSLSNCAICFVNGLQGLGRASAGATTGGSTKTLVSGVTGIIGQTSGDAKGDAAVLALLEGRLSQATTGVGALFKGGNYNSGVNPDYGLDLDTTINGVALTFNTADIRMHNADTLNNSASGVLTSSAAVAAPAFRVTNGTQITATGALTKANLQAASFWDVSTTGSTAIAVTLGSAGQSFDAGDVGRRLVFSHSANTGAVTVVANDTLTVTTAASAGGAVDVAGDFIECFVVTTTRVACSSVAQD